MPKVIAGMTMSLDGFVNDRSGRVDKLYRDLSPTNPDPRAAASEAATGAVLMGRRTFEMAQNPNAYAESYEFQVPLFVVTTHPPAPRPKENSRLTFTFVGDGVESAVAQARRAARERDVTVVGGPTLIRGLLRLGLVDELHIDVIPILLGEGLRLFADSGEAERLLRRIGIDEVPGGRIGLRFAANRPG